ncbi:MAG TPA: MgtC/SapB family protein [Burkholderiales bacterium]
MPAHPGAGLLDPAVWIALGASLGAGLLMGLERERTPSAKAGLRTFALVTLAGTLAALIGIRLESPWLAPAGLIAVAAMLVAAYAREAPQADPGTTTVAAALVAYLLGVLAGLGEAPLAGALAVGVTALLYFKPELEGFSAALTRDDLLSILQFLVVTLIVLPIVPDRGYGPYEVLNPRHIWLMVVLIAGVGLASYLVLRVSGSRHGVLITGVLGGLVSSTATTVLYARRSGDSPDMARIALVVSVLASLVSVARVAAIAALVAPAAFGRIGPVLGAALAAGVVATAFLMRRGGRQGALPIPEIRNPAELGIALQFAALYAIVLLGAAWLTDLAGDAGLYAAALASGFVDVDPATLSVLNLFEAGQVGADGAATAIALAVLANLVFKLGVLAWLGGVALAVRALAPFGAAAAGGALALAFG